MFIDYRPVIQIILSIGFLLIDAVIAYQTIRWIANYILSFEHAN